MQINDDWKKYINIDKVNNIISKIDFSNTYPNKCDIFKAFNLCKFQDLKVVIIGQDPYHGEGEANGLAFSLNEEVKITPSLRNIFKELYSDLSINKTNKDLSGWEKQGILLMNSILTVEKDKPLSHKNIGWEEITDYIIKKISEEKSNVVFILWGNNAIAKEKLIDPSKHLIIKSAHPSPLSASRGFFGSKPFSKTNNYLKKNNQPIIDWSL